MHTLRVLGIAALAAAIGAHAQSQPLTIGTTSLPAATLGVAYTYTLSASGGNPPYRWSAEGTVPGMFRLDAVTGIFSGTPDTPGTFSLTVQVADSAGATASRTFTFTVAIPPLRITTEGPLFSGTVGQFYSQVFQASGGTPPYTWAIVSGQLPAGLAFDAASGALTGAPSAVGEFTLAVQVTDSVHTAVSKSFVMTVGRPALAIAASILPNAVAGTAYSQKLSATGGTPPYRWSLSGPVAGLTLDSSSGVLAGTPPSPGTFTLTVQVKDSAGATATKAMTLTVTPMRLTITTGTTLPDGKIGVPYSATIVAAGGKPPFTWSANGLPEGLRMDSSAGAITGIPQAGGPLAFTIEVTDSASATAIDLFHLNIALPAAPNFVLSGLPPTSEPASQPTLRLSIDSPYPVSISGQLSLTFTPDIGAGDSTIQFATGGRTADFNIPAGATEAAFTVADMAIQTGTVAGAITVTVQASAGGVDITPAPEPSCTTRVDRGAPVIAVAKLVYTNEGFDVALTGYSTALEVTQAIFRFTAAGNSNLQNATVTVAVDNIFAAWYQDTASIRYGSQFTFTQKFTVNGDARAVKLDSVSLANRVGNTTFAAN